MSNRVIGFCIPTWWRARLGVFTLLLVGLLSPFVVAAGDFAVTGYLPYYRASSIPKLQYDKVTDIVYLALQPKADASLDTSDLVPARLRELVAAAKPSGVRVHVAVGGWGRSGAFPMICASAELRDRFAANLLEFCQAYGLSGVDLDWEYPRGEQQVADFSRLLVAIKGIFASEKRLLSVAVPGEGAAPVLDKSGLAAIDRLHLMSYDHRAPHSTLAQARRDVHLWLERGAKPEKILLGVPFYGRNEARQAKTFEELHRTLGADGKSDIADGYHFNGHATLSAKVHWAKQEGLGGVMIWELGQDVTGEASLLRALHGAAHAKR